MAISLKAAPMDKNEHKEAATHCPSPPLLPAVAPQTSSMVGQAIGHHAFREAGFLQAACSSHHTYLLLPGIDFRVERGWRQQEELPRQGTRAPYGLEATTASPELVVVLHSRVLGIVSCLQSHLRTEKCLVRQRQFPHLSGNKSTDLKAKFQKTKNYQLEACTIEINLGIREDHND